MFPELVSIPVSKSPKTHTTLFSPTSQPPAPPTLSPSSLISTNPLLSHRCFIYFLCNKTPYSKSILSYDFNSSDPHLFVNHELLFYPDLTQIKISKPFSQNHSHPDPLSTKLTIYTSNHLTYPLAHKQPIAFLSIRIHRSNPLYTQSPINILQVCVSEPGVVNYS